MNDQTQFYSSRHPVESKRLDAFVDAAFAFAVLCGLYVLLF